MLGAPEGYNNDKDHQDITIGGDVDTHHTHQQIIGSEARAVVVIVNGDESYFELSEVLGIAPETIATKEHIYEFLRVLESKNFKASKI